MDAIDSVLGGYAEVPLPFFFVSGTPSDRSPACRPELGLTNPILRCGIFPGTRFEFLAISAAFRPWGNSTHCDFSDPTETKPMHLFFPAI